MKGKPKVKSSFKENPEEIKWKEKNLESSESFNSENKEIEPKNCIIDRRTNNDSFSSNPIIINNSSRNQEAVQLINALTDYILMNFNENLESLENLYQTCLTLTSLKNSENVQSILHLRKGKIKCLKCENFKEIHKIKDIRCTKSSCRICLDCRATLGNSCPECRRLYSDNEKLRIHLSTC